MKSLNELREQWQFRGSNRPDFAITPLENQESVWDYPRPPVLAPDERHVLVSFRGKTLVDSRRAIRLLETSCAPCFYIPNEDTDLTLLRKNQHTTFCEWKGTATYFDLVSGPENVAWCYEDPFSEFNQVKDWLAFYPSLVNCEVAGEKVRAQAGGYYGGWITSEIVGPFKGEQGVQDLKS